MITYRCELQLIDETSFLDIWKGFCTWRSNSKYTPTKERNWINANNDFLSSESVTFEFTNNRFTKIERIINEEEKLFCIRYIQNEGAKTFTTIIIVNLEIKALSYTMEELPFNLSEYKKKRFIPKPQFFSKIDSYIDKKFAPLDTSGKPLSFTPNIFVSESIPSECFEYLKSKYEYTANIRIDNKSKNIKIENPDLIENEKNLEKKSSYFIISKKNFDFVDTKLTWYYLQSKFPSFNNVYFEPWIGKKFNDNGGIFNKKILVIGNNHYCKRNECGKCGISGYDFEDWECYNMTISVIRMYINWKKYHDDYEKWMDTFSNFEKSLSSSSDSETIWNSISFYNYLQCAVNRDEDKTNSQKIYNKYKTDYCNSETALWEVITCLKPDYIITWGSIIRDHIGKKITSKTGIPTLMIHHPSQCYDISYWKEEISKFLD